MGRAAQAPAKAPKHLLHTRMGWIYEPNFPIAPGPAGNTLNHSTCTTALLFKNGE